jgi:hypothetical protein
MSGRNQEQICRVCGEEATQSPHVLPVETLELPKLAKPKPIGGEGWGDQADLERIYRGRA